MVSKIVHFCGYMKNNFENIIKYDKERRIFNIIEFDNKNNSTIGNNNNKGKLIDLISLFF